MKIRGIFSTAAILIALAMILSACGGTPTPEVAPPSPPDDAPEPTSPPAEPTEAQPTEPDEPVTLRVGWLEPIDCWNMSGCQSFWTWGDLVAETLVGKGYPNCEPTPRGATSLQESDDGLTWTFTIPEGATYSDGSPADAQGWADSYIWRVGIPSLAGWYSALTSMESIEAPDETTLVWKLSEPARLMTTDLRFMYVRPVSVWGDLTEDNVFDFENYPPVGNGPYAVTEYVEGSHVIFDARPEYPLGKPPIDRIILQFFASPDVMVNAFLSGDIDMTGRLPPEYYDTLASAPNASVFEGVAGNKYELDFNMAEEGIKHPAVEDLAVRTAIDYAINRQQLIDVALLGHGALCPTNWACAPNMVNQLNPDLTLTPYDPEMAKQILEEAGYVDTDGDGIRETPDGLPLEFRLFFQVEHVPMLTVSDMISGWLREVGIETDVEALEFGMATQGVLNERDFDLMIYNMYTDIDAGAHLDYTISCWAADAGAVGRNYPGWCDEEFDNLLYTFYNEFDTALFEEALYEAERIMHEERPFITLFGINNVQAYRNDRFEFPVEGICHESEGGLMSYYPLMSAEVK